MTVRQELHGLAVACGARHHHLPSKLAPAPGGWKPQKPHPGLPSCRRQRPLTCGGMAGCRPASGSRCHVLTCPGERHGVSRYRMRRVTLPRGDKHLLRATGVQSLWASERPAGSTGPRAERSAAQRATVPSTRSRGQNVFCDWCIRQTRLFPASFWRVPNAQS